MPLISVIVPNYNHAAFLPERLNSIFNQTYRDFEVIILDDCSKDNSRQVIDTFKSNSNISHIVYNETNSGSPFKQWNKGISLAKGKYVWIAESDDFCDHNFLQVAVDKLTNNNADIFYANSVKVNHESKPMLGLDWWYKDLDETRWKHDYVNNANDEIKNYLAKKCTIVNASAVVFKNKKELASNFSTVDTFKICGDWLFWLMYLHSSEKIVYSTETNNYFRDHYSNTRTNLPYQKNFEILKIYKWICQNVLNKTERSDLINYYFSRHLNFYSRKEILQNIKFAFQSFKYTSFTFWFLIKYYLNVKLFNGTIKQG